MKNINTQECPISKNFEIIIEESASTLTEGRYGKYSEGSGTLYGGGF
jgi:hypothetical protein